MCASLAEQKNVEDVVSNDILRIYLQLNNGKYDAVVVGALGQGRPRQGVALIS